LITIPSSFIWILCPAWPLRRNLHDNFINLKFFLKQNVCVPCRILRLNFHQNGTLRAPWHRRRLDLSLKRDTSSLSIPSASKISFKRDSWHFLAFSASKFSPKRDASHPLAPKLPPKLDASRSLAPSVPKTAPKIKSKKADASRPRKTENLEKTLRRSGG